MSNAMVPHVVILASPPDREKLVAEISDGHDVWAVVNQETGEFVVEILSRGDGSPWIFPLDEVLEAMKRATSSLLGETA
jgi:hypothetical protein